TGRDDQSSRAPQRLPCRAPMSIRNGRVCACDEQYYRLPSLFVAKLSSAGRTRASAPTLFSPLRVSSSALPRAARFGLLSPGRRIDRQRLPTRSLTSPGSPPHCAQPFASCDRRYWISSCCPSPFWRRWPCPRRERGAVARSADRPCRGPQLAFDPDREARSSDSRLALSDPSPAGQSSRSDRDSFPRVAVRRGRDHLVSCPRRAPLCASIRQLCLHSLFASSQAGADRQLRSRPAS